MAAISSYPYDIVIQDNDAWIGTDSVNRKTKQYTAEAVANYLNINGKVSVGGQMVYSFSSVPLSGNGTFSLPNGGGSSAYSAITSLKVSILEKSGQNVVAFVSYLVGSEILISAQDEVSSFGHYGVTSYSVDPTNNGYYVLELSYIGGNGSIVADKLYDIVDFVKANSAEVEVVGGGLGINMTGTTEQPIVNIDYSGSDNFIEIATEITSVDTGIYSPELLVSKSNPSEPVSEVKKIKISNITLEKLGQPTTNLSFNNNRLTNLSLPVDLNDAVNKQYVLNTVGGYVSSIGNGPGIKVYGSTTQPTVQVEFLGLNNYIQKASTITSIDASEIPFIPVERSTVNTSFGAGLVSKIKLSEVAIDKLGAPVASLSMGSQKITNLATPTLSSDAATKAYADSLVTGGTVTSIAEGTGISIPNSPLTTSGSIGLNYFTYIDSTPNGSSTAASTDEIPISRPGTPSRVYKTSFSNIPIASLTAVKNYIDSAVVGSLIYQGGYNASTNAPDLTTSPNSIIKGWTYTVTVDGTFLGEQLRVGDVLIAESNDPSSIADWTTVQNNIDLASATQVGIGNVLAGEAVDVTYSAGSATVSVEDSTASNKGAVIVAGGTNISVAYVNGTATVTNTYTSPASSASGTISAGQTSATVTHALGLNVIVQTYKSTGETVFCDIDRTATTVTATIGSSISSDINIIVHKIT